MNYYNEYGSRELVFMNKYVSSQSWLSDFVKEIKKDNTSLHDLLIITNNGKQYTVEVKEDEIFWFSKTGNIGLDYISSFRFKNINDKEKWPSLWVPSNEISYFESIISVEKYGKLITCDADFQFYYVLDESKQNFIFAALYDNRKLKNAKFVNYLKSNYKLRINDKKKYKLPDNWESAAFFVNPLNDKMLKECEVNSIEKMEE